VTYTISLELNRTLITIVSQDKKQETQDNGEEEKELNRNTIPQKNAKTRW
jgi:hypothetical protein